MNRRHVWALGGTAVVLVTAIIAATNLREIYLSQKDFVIGSLLSLAGFCFGKAVNRTAEERAQWLQESGASDDLSKLESNIHSTAERLSEFYWRLDDRPDLLRVAVDDLNKATAYLSSLRHELGATVNRQEWQIPATAQVSLDRIRRDLHEAINRLNRTRERLGPDLAAPEHQTVWDVFDVLATDLLKANRNLDATRGAHLPFPPNIQVENAANYLNAASERADELSALLSARGLEPPETFRIMCRDLRGAIDGLRTVDLAAATR
ncbi:hypothetical protein [Phytohabitans aurantiacus]|jgi:hypothetical protein|uniref:Uncharacterized protein n=1 Tax=Phytohabitans aurantiacus TaxID=3016789 RepID=A0ABQ5QPV4_9ACTN|nr:hypothetical protein [Phytohabitans aurantiacus]GLH96671.1 hypothetical protein Pa4123_19450 [Phytohabitans aurantiacus]